MKFSKEQFKKNADKHTQRIVAKYVDSLDGKEVKIEDGDVYGTCKFTHEGEKFILYPIYRVWCDEEQLSLLKEDTKC